MALRIGCGGCFAGDQLPSTQLAISYPSGHVEAFSQAAMFEFDDHEYGSPERQFDSSLVAPAVCADRHFTLVLEVFENATEDVYWAAVIGRGEWFTIEELLNYASSVLSIHGSQWTNLGWTAYVTFFVAILLVSLGKVVAYRLMDPNDPLRAYKVYDVWIFRFPQDPREVCYEIAIELYVWCILEVGLHWILAAATPGVHVEPFAIIGTWFMIISFGNVMPLIVTLLCWKSLYEEDRRASWVRADIWAIAEILVGLSFTILLGAGLGYAPWFNVLAGVIRLRETEWVRGLLESRAGVSPLAGAGISKIAPIFQNI